MQWTGIATASAHEGAEQRGVALLLAVATSVALSLLALSVLASREASVATGAHGETRARARAAAACGIEWALARAVAGDLSMSTTTLALESGDAVQVAIDPDQSPHVVADGLSSGMTVRLRADLLAEQPSAPPHAWVSLSGTSEFPGDLTVRGSAHLNASPWPIAWLQPGKLRMSGDLHLVTTSTLGSMTIVHASGATKRGVPAIAAPTIEFAALPSAASGGVAVTTYTGDTQIANTTLTGVLRVSLAAGQTLDLRQLTLNGTLVVSSPVSSFNPAKIKLNNLTLTGGTAITGNLAVLAPDAELEATGCEVRGVTVVGRVANTSNASFRGQLITMAAVVANGFTVDRSVSFVPDTPLGLRWGARRWRLDWLGAP